MTKHVVYEIVDEVELDPVGEEESVDGNEKAGVFLSSTLLLLGVVLCEEGRCQ